MISYRDTTFCSSLCINKECKRNAQIAYNELANLPEEDRLPIAFGDFKDSDMCPGYIGFAQQIGIDETTKS